MGNCILLTHRQISKRGDDAANIPRGPLRRMFFVASKGSPERGGQTVKIIATAKFLIATL